MGIPYLNQYIQEHCKTSVKEVSLNELRGKKIVIDTSIYLYLYLSKGNTDDMIEGFYILITKLRQFNIIPIFIFDGKPPPEKLTIIKERKRKKDIAKNKL